MEWRLDNIKCGGCARRISQAISRLEGVSQVEVVVDQGLLSFDVDHPDLLPQVAQLLFELGYPRAGEASGLSAVGAKVRSVVSCVAGRLSSDEMTSQN